MVKVMDNTLKKWLDDFFGANSYSCAPLPGDASFRQYYRLQNQANQWIVMHSPALNEPIAPFVTIAKLWHAQGIAVPNIVAFDEISGFVLMTDFGDRLLQDNLNETNAPYFYGQALQTLLSIQKMPQQSVYTYSLFDAQHIKKELSLFKDWFLTGLLSLELNTAEEKLWAGVCDHLVHSCVSQPQTLIHRDYHSRNLMVLNDATLGVIDFQDAMIGPVTYDAVSLLRDCYINWSIEKVYQWLHDFFYQHSPLAQAYSFITVKEWFDKAGLQRHLKVLGVFSRLKLRDGKARYLNDIPRITVYLLDIMSQYPEFSAFERWFSERVLPKLYRTLIQEGVAVVLPDDTQERRA